MIITNRFLAFFSSGPKAFAGPPLQIFFLCCQTKAGPPRFVITNLSRTIDQTRFIDRAQMGKKSKTKKGNGRKEQPMANPPARTVPDPPAARTFQGIGFRFGPGIVTYEDYRLQQVVYPAIDSVLRNHGFSGYEPAKVLAHVVGYEAENFITLKGPPFSAADSFAFVEGVPGGPFHMPNLLLAKDRAMVDDLMEVVFSKPDSVARNSSAIPLFAKQVGYKQKISTGFREWVAIYSVAESPDEVLDSMLVTIQGQGSEPNQFKFQPSFLWLQNRYRQPTGLDQSAAGID